MGACFLMAKDPAENFESVVDYTTVLDNFEGPLDLLLFLIKQEQIEIKDVFVSKVTEQFLDYMKGLPYIDIDKASEYLSIASTILEIKAKSLVPAIVEQETDEEDAESVLIRALEEYKLLKEESAKLKELENLVKEKLDLLNNFKKENKSNNESDLNVLKYFNDYKNQYLNNKKGIYNEFENKISSILKEIKQETKMMKKLFSFCCSQLYKLRPSALEKFSKKEQKEIINKNKKSFQIQIATKNKTLSSIN